jgi:uncharacterized protein YyaL (SSP411 family)
MIIRTGFCLIFLLVTSFVLLLAVSCPGGKGIDNGAGDGGSTSDGNGSKNGEVAASASFLPPRHEPVPKEKFIPRQDYWQPGGVGWLSFDNVLFEKALKEKKLIALFEAESVLPSTTEYFNSVFAGKGIKERLAESYLPVWVDRDRYPGLCERYQAYKSIVPSVLVLHPTGPQVLTRTAADSDLVVDWLNHAAKTWTENPSAYDTIANAAYTDFQTNIAPIANKFAESLGSEIPADTYDKVLNKFMSMWNDEAINQSGGYLFAKLDVIALLNDAALRDNDKAKDAAGKLLTGLIDNQTDKIEGGLYSYIGAKDDTYKNYAKRLDANTQFALELTKLYIATGDQKYKDAATTTIDFIVKKFGRNEVDRVVAFSNFQVGDPAYFEGDVNKRKSLIEPTIDPTTIAEFNFMAIESLVWGHYAIDDSKGWLEIAMSVADNMIKYMKDGNVFARYAADPLPKMHYSVDQVWAARALLTLYMATGVNDYRDVAIEIQEGLRDKFWAPKGGLIDVEKNSPGLFVIPFWPMGDASIAARNEMILRSLSLVTGDENAGKEHIDRAKDYLSVFSNSYLPDKGINSQSAKYAIAAREVLSEPLDFHLLFKDAPTGEAQNAIKEAFTVKFPYRVMEILNVGEDDARITELGYTTTVPVWLYLCYGGQCAKVSPGEVGTSVERLKHRMIDSGLVYKTADAADAESAKTNNTTTGANPAGG